jgi:hypothetical protein
VTWKSLASDVRPRLLASSSWAAGTTLPRGSRGSSRKTESGTPSSGQEGRPLRGPVEPPTRRSGCASPERPVARCRSSCFQHVEEGRPARRGDRGASWRTSAGVSASTSWRRSSPRPRTPPTTRGSSVRWPPCASATGSVEGMRIRWWCYSSADFSPCLAGEGAKREREPVRDSADARSEDDGGAPRSTTRRTAPRVYHG